MYNKDFSVAADELAEKYIEIKKLELLAKNDEKLKKNLTGGKNALQEAKRIQEEFYPLSDDSEKIIMTLLNQKFVYDGIDYSDEIDKSILKYCDIGLVLYVAITMADEIEILNKTINDLQENDFF